MQSPIKPFAQEAEKKLKLFFFFLKSYGCCKNAIKASSAGACRGEQELFTFLEMR